MQVVIVPGEHLTSAHGCKTITPYFSLLQVLAWCVELGASHVLNYCVQIN